MVNHIALLSNLIRKSVNANNTGNKINTNHAFRDIWLLSRSPQKPLISLDLVGRKLYCFRDGVLCHHCLYIIFSTNPVRRSEELRSGPIFVLQDTGLTSFISCRPLVPSDLLRATKMLEVLLSRSL